MSEEETFSYFAYGSNMLTARIRDKERAPSAVFDKTVKGSNLVLIHQGVKSGLDSCMK